MKGSGPAGQRERAFLLVYLAGLVFAGVLTVGRIGITWDEPNYFASSYLYLSWFGHVLSQPSDWWSSIDHYWRQSHEAPPFLKLLGGLFAGAGALLFGTKNLYLIGLFYRMASYTLFVLSVLAAFWFVRKEFGRAEGWGAAVSLPLVPALFGFARLGQLDGAAAAMYLLSAVALFRMMSEKVTRRRAVLTGVLVGMALATKITTFPLLPAAVLWAGTFRRSSLPRLLVCFGVGAVSFFALWPWLWRAPFSRTYEFLTWAANLRSERFTYYLGEWWAGTPFHYPLVALLALVPLAVAACGALGLVRLLRSAGKPAPAWLVLNLALVVAVAASGLAPVYGGPRQFLAAFSLWAVCAGVGFGWLARRFHANLPVALAVYAALALPGILWTGTENSLEYYGEAAGLIPGAKALGFETTYLADTYEPAVRWANANVPKGATLYVQAGTYPVAESYRRTGRLRRDLRPAYLDPTGKLGKESGYPTDERPRRNSYFLFLPRQSVYTDQMLALDRKKPLYADEKGGVALVKVYSGRAAGESFAARGRPKARKVGALNAAPVGLGLLGLFAWTVRSKKKEDEQQKEQKVPEGK